MEVEIRTELGCGRTKAIEQHRVMTIVENMAALIACKVQSEVILRRFW
jgi:hypothetical protein